MLEKGLQFENTNCICFLSIHVNLNILWTSHILHNHQPLCYSFRFRHFPLPVSLGFVLFIFFFLMYFKPFFKI